MLSPYNGGKPPDIGTADFGLVGAGTTGVGIVGATTGVLTGIGDGELKLVGAVA